MTEEEKFIEHTGYIFDFEECVVLIKEHERTLYKDTDFETPEEANKLIEDGWTPIPF